jgi:hypothetical protein
MDVFSGIPKSLPLGTCPSGTGLDQAGQGAKAFFRDAFNPEHRFRDLGFRVVAESEAR